MESPLPLYVSGNTRIIWQNLRSCQFSLNVWNDVESAGAGTLRRTAPASDAFVFVGHRDVPQLSIPVRPVQRSNVTEKYGRKQRNQRERIASLDVMRDAGCICGICCFTWES